MSLLQYDIDGSCLLVLSALRFALGISILTRFANVSKCIWNLLSGSKFAAWSFVRLAEVILLCLLMKDMDSSHPKFKSNLFSTFVLLCLLHLIRYNLDS